MQSLEDATPAETEAVRQLLHQTMPDATLVRVQRNQHELLYQQYVARRNAVDAEAGNVHERWLWNGNDSIAENISKGFDLRYASQEFNKYGVGVYFAADAHLSAYFERSTRDSTGEKKLILARVALGKMAERRAVGGQAQMNRTASGGMQMINPELTKPEWKLPPPGAQSATSRQRIEAIVYENHQAFPHYLVTYTAGPRRNPYGGGMDLCRIDDAPHNSDIRVRNGQVQSFLSVAQERAAAAAAAEAAEQERREREAEKQRFMQWATSPERGCGEGEAESVWERQVRTGGELTGDPIADARTAVRQLREERAQAAEEERRKREVAEAAAVAAREEAREAQRRAEVAQQKADAMAQAGYGGNQTPIPVLDPAPAPAPADTQSAGYAPLGVSGPAANARSRRSQQQQQLFDMTQLLSEDRSSWDDAVRASGHSDNEALALGVSRFLLWHAARPVVYFIFFGVYAASGDLIANQLIAGSFILGREGLYLLSVTLCTWLRPAFLLVDIGATARGGVDGIKGHFWAVTYVLAPEKFVMRVLFSAAADLEKRLLDWMRGLPGWLKCLAFMLVYLPALYTAAAAISVDITAVPYALGAGLGADDVPLALLLGYIIAAVGSLWVLLPALATVPAFVAGFWFLFFLCYLVFVAVVPPAMFFWRGFRDARIHALREDCAESLATMGGWPCANTTTVHVPPAVAGEGPAALGCSIETQAVVDLTYSSCADLYEHYFTPAHWNPFRRGFSQGRWNAYGCADEEWDDELLQCTPQGLLDFSLPGFVYAPELDFEQNFANMTALVAAIAGSCGCAEDAGTLQLPAGFGVRQTTEHWGCGCGGCGCLEQERCICGGPCSAQLNETQCTATDGPTFFFADTPCAWDDDAEAGEPKCAAAGWHSTVEGIVVVALMLCGFWCYMAAAKKILHD